MIADILTAPDGDSAWFERRFDLYIGERGKMGKGRIDLLSGEMWTNSDQTEKKTHFSAN